jgi:hypothetical protein
LFISDEDDTGGCGKFTSPGVDEAVEFTDEEEDDTEDDL